MAQDQAQKRVNLALRMVASATKINDGLTELVDQANEYSISGLTFIDEDFNNQGLYHLTPGLATTMLGDAQAIKTALSVYLGLLAQMKL